MEKYLFAVLCVSSAFSGCVSPGDLAQARRHASAMESRAQEAEEAAVVLRASLDATEDAADGLREDAVAARERLVDRSERAADALAADLQADAEEIPGAMEGRADQVETAVAGGREAADALDGLAEGLDDDASAVRREAWAGIIETIGRGLSALPGWGKIVGGAALLLAMIVGGGNALGVRRRRKDRNDG